MKTLLVGILSLIAISSYAQDTAEQRTARANLDAANKLYNDNAPKLKARVLDITNRINLIEAETKISDTDLGTAKNQVAKIYQCRRDNADAITSGKPVVGCEPSDLKNSKDWIERINNRKVALDKELAALTAEKNKADTGLGIAETAMKTIKADKESADLSVQEVWGKLAQQDLTQYFNAADYKLKNVGAVLQVIETKYDAAILGMYMRQKMTQMLNSEAICSATTSCSDPKNNGKAKVGADLINKLFSQNSNTRASGQVPPKGGQ